jgi:hypothetical protein
MVQQSELYNAPWYKPHPFVFEFNKVLLAGSLIMVQYQLQILVTDHGESSTEIAAFSLRFNY